MTGFILKLSFNTVGKANLEGGICGSFFFISSNLAITAQHVLNSNTFKSNVGLRKCKVWLIAQPNIIIEIKLKDIIEHSEIDTTLIQLSKSFPIKVRNCSLNNADSGHECYNEGFTGGQMPNMKVSWGQNGLIIYSCSDNKIITNGHGKIKQKCIMTVNATDIKMTNVVGYATSYGGVVGMSGGPLICKQTDQILGLMSMGLPADNPIKNSLFAVSIQEINNRIKNGA